MRVDGRRASTVLPRETTPLIYQTLNQMQVSMIMFMSVISTFYRIRVDSLNISV